MKKISYFLVLSAVSGISLICSPAAKAQTLVTYDFSNSAVTSFYDSTTLNTAATTVSSNMSASSVLSTETMALRIQSTGSWSGNYLSTTPGNTAVNTNATSGTPLTTAAAAVSAGSYMTVTFTASSGFVLDLSSFSFDVTKGGGNTRGFALQTSVTGFSTDGSTNLTLAGTSPTFTSDASTTSGANIALTTQKASFSTVTIDLSGAAYDNLGTFEVRIFSFANTVGSSVEFDNIVLNGTVVSVPEPSTMALLAASGVFGVALLRRKRNLSI